MAGLAVVSGVRNFASLGIERIGQIYVDATGVEHGEPYRLFRRRSDVWETPLIADTWDEGIERIILDIHMAVLKVDGLNRRSAVEGFSNGTASALSTYVPRSSGRRRGDVATGSEDRNRDSALVDDVPPRPRQHAVIEFRDSSIHGVEVDIGHFVDKP